MINLDDRLIKETLPKIKPNALAVLLSIAIHLNKKSGRCFPSHRRLMELTGLGRDAVYSALEVLKKEGLLKSNQAIDSKTKSFGRRTFSVSTRFISIFVMAEDAEPLPENPDTAHPDTAHPDTAHPETQQLNEVERLNKLEQLNEVGVTNTPAPENSETLKAEFPQYPKVAPKGSFPSGPAQFPTAPPEAWQDMGGVIKVVDPELPGVLIVDGGKPAPATIAPDQYPNPKTSQQLKEAMRAYFVANPNEWTIGVLEQTRASNWTPEKIADCMTAFCAHQEAEGNLRRTYGQYKGMLVKWFLSQPAFDRNKPAPNAHTTQQTPPANYTSQTRH